MSTLGHLKLKADTDADSARTMDGQSTSGVLEEQETGYCGKIKRWGYVYRSMAHGTCELVWPRLWWT